MSTQVNELVVPHAKEEINYSDAKVLNGYLPLLGTQVQQYIDHLTNLNISVLNDTEKNTFCSIRKEYRIILNDIQKYIHNETNIQTHVEGC